MACGFYLKVINRSANSHKILSSFVILQLFPGMTGFIPSHSRDERERITHSNFPNNSHQEQYNCYQLI